MTNDFPTDQLIRDSFSACRKGCIDEDPLLLSPGRCRENGADRTLNAIGR